MTSYFVICYKLADARTFAEANFSKNTCVVVGIC